MDLTSNSGVGKLFWPAGQISPTAKHSTLARGPLNEMEWNGMKWIECGPTQVVWWSCCWRWASRIDLCVAGRSAMLWHSSWMLSISLLSKYMSLSRRLDSLLSWHLAVDAVSLSAPSLHCHLMAQSNKSNTINSVPVPSAPVNYLLINFHSSIVLI